MFYLLSIICFVLRLQCIVGQGRDVTYSASFSDDVKNCKDFKNEKYQCDKLILGSEKGSDEGQGVMSLSGSITFKSPVEKGMQIEMNIFKILEIGEEYMYNAMGDICGNLDNKEAPWWPLIESLNISSCPIVASEYPITDMHISLDFASDVLCHEFCGEYNIELLVFDADFNQMSCHIIGVAVGENEAK